MADLDRSGWVAFANSSKAGNGPELTIDGDDSTHWQSDTPPPFGSALYPFDLWFDMGAAYQVNYIRFDAQLSFFPSGIPGDVEIYLSDDGLDWGTPVGVDTWHDLGAFNTPPQIIVFPQQTRRWIKIHMLNAAPGPFQGAYGMCSEFNAGYDPAAIGTLGVQHPTMPDGTMSVPYSFGLRITQGVTPYTCSVHSGSLAAGMTVSNSGMITGTPTAGGDFTATIRVTDAAATIVDVAIVLYVFRPGAPTGGATILQLAFVWWSRYAQQTPDHGGPAVYLGSPANPPGSLIDPGFSNLPTPDRPQTSPSGYPKQGTVFVFPDLTTASLGPCGMVVTGEVIDASPASGNGGTVIWFSIQGKILAFNDLNEFDVFGCYLLADYSDGTRVYSYPTTESVVEGNEGTIDNPELAIDDSLDTFAHLSRSSFHSLTSPPYLRLTGFGVFSPAPIPPPPVLHNVGFILSY